MILAVLGVMVAVAAVVLVIIVIFSHGFRVGRLTAERDIARDELKDLRRKYNLD